MTPLQNEFSDPRPLSLETREWLATSVLPILALAQDRITNPQIKRLEAIVATLPDDPPVRGSSEFRIQLWMTLARSTRNSAIVEGVKWWARVMRAREQSTGIDSTGPDRVIPKAMYRGLILTLRRGSGAPEFWASVIKQVID